MSQLGPLTPRERFVTVDVLRGLALLGVLIGNTFWLYSARAWEHHPEPRRLDTIARWLVLLLVQSKAQTLLTFLFGFGFAAQFLRAEERGGSITGLYARRLLALWGIGALHVMLWWGDVTWTYAVAGFGLLLFRRSSERARLVWALLLVLVPAAIGSLPAVRSATAGLFVRDDQAKHGTQAFLAALHGRRFWPVVGAHLRFALLFQAPIYAWYYLWLLGHFLLGSIAGTQRWFDRAQQRGAPSIDSAQQRGAPLLDEHQRARFRRLLRLGLLAALPGAALSIARLLGAFKGRMPGVAAQLGFGLVDQVSRLGLAAAYLALVVLLLGRPGSHRVLRLFAAPGRMPLTTYVAQSVASTALFYGWGLGWAGHVRAAGCVAIALVLFTLELVACHLWLRRFRFGPLEWLWRTLVYLRPPAMRVGEPSGAAAVG